MAIPYRPCRVQAFDLATGTYLRKWYVRRDGDRPLRMGAIRPALRGGVQLRNTITTDWDYPIDSFYDVREYSRFFAADGTLTRSIEAVYETLYHNGFSYSAVDRDASHDSEEWSDEFALLTFFRVWGQASSTSPLAAAARYASIDVYEDESTTRFGYMDADKEPWPYQNTYWLAAVGVDDFWYRRDLSDGYTITSTYYRKVFDLDPRYALPSAVLGYGSVIAYDVSREILVWWKNGVGATVTDGDGALIAQYAIADPDSAPHPPRDATHAVSYYDGLLTVSWRGDCENVSIPPYTWEDHARIRVYDIEDGTLVRTIGGIPIVDPEYITPGYPTWARDETLFNTWEDGNLSNWRTSHCIADGVLYVIDSPPPDPQYRVDYGYWEPGPGPSAGDEVISAIIDDVFGQHYTAAVNATSGAIQLTRRHTAGAGAMAPIVTTAAAGTSPSLTYRDDGVLDLLYLDGGGNLRRRLSYDDGRTWEDAPV